MSSHLNSRALSQQERRRIEVIERKHEMQMKALYNELKTAGEKEKKAIIKLINKCVEDFNFWHPKDVNYYDLHWMTVSGALDYVRRIVADTPCHQIKTVIYLETGRGNHSNLGKPAIKRELKAKYGSMDGCTIQEDPRNYGVLRLVLKWRK